MVDKARSATVLQPLTPPTSLLHSSAKFFSLFFYSCLFSVLKRKPFFLSNRFDIGNVFPLFLLSQKGRLFRKVTISALKQTQSYQFLVVMISREKINSSWNIWKKLDYHSCLKCRLSSWTKTSRFANIQHCRKTRALQLPRCQSMSKTKKWWNRWVLGMLSIVFFCVSLLSFALVTFYQQRWEEKISLL